MGNPSHVTLGIFVTSALRDTLSHHITLPRAYLGGSDLRTLGTT
jgi:hypothetical protein